MIWHLCGKPFQSRRHDCSYSQTACQGEPHHGFRAWQYCATYPRSPEHHKPLYWKGHEIGTILKKPKAGSFLANVAQGGHFELVTLDPEIKKSCDKVAAALLSDGIDLIAYDVLDGKISEVNVTCPGLIVEVSHALGRNLAAEFMTKI